MSRPLVSVITNCFNSEKYIRASVESVLRQDYGEWEHIVIDCGSTDNSLNILSQIAHDRLRLLQVPFCGVAAARNIGISEARGQIIAVLDSDDYALPQRLTRQVNTLLSMPDIVGVGSGFMRLSEATQRCKSFVYPFDHEQLAILLQAGFSPIPHSTLAFRLSSYHAVGGYSNTIEKAEDFDLLVRLANTGPLHSLPEALVLCTHRDNSHTKRHQPGGRDTVFYVVLALIMNSVERGAPSPPQAVVEQWLEGIGPHGIRAMLGRWSLRTIRQKIGRLDARVLVYLTRIFLANAPSMLRCHRQEWWRGSKTPRDIAANCTRFNVKRAP